tara:strand:+ start:7154 stop:7759 length:606 start_codon:yes stop_codon:yes gene_type:complete
MARRTKDESEQTHAAILDAAIEEFFRRGVARTTLQDIAKTSGYTRGAVYHHFKNKGEIIIRLLESVRLPVETIRKEFAEDNLNDPLGALHRWSKNAIHKLANDERACKVHWIYLRSDGREEMEEVYEAEEEKVCGVSEIITEQLDKARKLGQLRPGVEPRVASAALYALYTGLYYNYLRAGGSKEIPFDLTLDTFFRGLKP